MTHFELLTETLKTIGIPFKLTDELEGSDCQEELDTVIEVEETPHPDDDLTIAPRFSTYFLFKQDGSFKAANIA